MRGASLILVAAVTASAASLAADSAANPDQKPPRCFRPDWFQSWRAPDDHTIYIRVFHDQFYRLDLTAVCPLLTWPGAHLVTRFDGTNQVCRALDWQLSVAAPGSGSVGCIVKQMTPLSPAEAAAIPKKFKP